MKRILLIITVLIMSVNASNMDRVTIKGKYRYNKAVVNYINSLPKKKITTVTHLAYTLWQEGRNRSSGDVEFHYTLIASVIVNRAKLKRRYWGKTIYQVIHKRKQFSCWNGTNGKVYVNSDYKEFLLALKVANKFVHRHSQPITNATYYHERHIYPKWRLKLTRLIVFGGHIFYRT